MFGQVGIDRSNEGFECIRCGSVVVVQVFDNNRLLNRIQFDDPREALHVFEAVERGKTTGSA